MSLTLATKLSAPSVNVLVIGIVASCSRMRLVIALREPVAVQDLQAMVRDVIEPVGGIVVAGPRAGQEAGSFARGVEQVGERSDQPGILRIAHAGAARLACASRSEPGRRVVRR